MKKETVKYPEIKQNKLQKTKFHRNFTKRLKVNSALGLFNPLK